MKPSARQIMTDAALRVLAHKPHYSSLHWFWRVVFLGPYLRVWYAALAGKEE